MKDRESMQTNPKGTNGSLTLAAGSTFLLLPPLLPAEKITSPNQLTPALLPPTPQLSTPLRSTPPPQMSPVLPHLPSSSLTLDPTLPRNLLQQSAWRLNAILSLGPKSTGREIGRG